LKTNRIKEDSGKKQKDKELRTLKLNNNTPDYKISSKEKDKNKKENVKKR